MKRHFLPLAVVCAFFVATALVAQTATDLHRGKVRIGSTATDALCVGSSGGASPTCTGGVKGGTLAISNIGVNSTSDVTLSNNLMDATGTPSRQSGCGGGGATAGRDYAFTQSRGGGTDTNCVVLFGHTWSTAPVCVASIQNGNVPVTTINASTTGVTLSYASTSSSEMFQVLCRSY